MSGLGECVLVIGALAATYSLPAWRLSARISGAFGWPTVLLGSIVLGTGSQAIFGLFWGRFIKSDATFELLFYMAFWLAVNVLLLVVRKIPGHSRRGISLREGLALCAVLVTALAVRSIHPLQHYALGQSDAYNHLNYLRDVLQFGYILNPTYPPGFSWILALPTWLFRLDPYNTCRFGGAFFGVALVLALYVLVRDSRGARAALGGAFLAACFPGLYLLIKTGVGVFANQYGILLLPVIIYFALESGREEFSFSSGGVWMLAFSLASLAVSVPMVLLHVTWVLLLAGVVSLASPGVRRPPLRLSYLLFLLPPFFLAALHFSQLSAEVIDGTLYALSAAGDVSRGDVPGEGTPGMLQKVMKFWPYAEDYFSVKRAGTGSPLLNLAGAGLGLAFLLVAASGVFLRDAFLRVLGLWGLLGVVHVLFGFLQFSSYQREGWSLLVATACLGGMATAVAYAVVKDRPAGPLVYYITAGVMLTAALARPPGHLFMTSEAEEEIVALIRAVQEKGVDGAFPLQRDAAVLWREAGPGCDPAGGGWTIVTRQFIQHGLVRALVDREGHYVPGEVRKDNDLRTVFKEGACCLVILERTGLPDPGGLKVLYQINQPLMDQFAHLLTRYYETQERLENFLAELEREGWRSVRLDADSTLEVLALFHAPEG